MFTTLVVLRDPDVSVGEWDRRFLLCTVVTVAIVLSALGLGAILAIYMQPSSYAVADQGLFYSWEMDFDALGYSAEEYVERSRLAVAWASLTTLAYMIIVNGGKLIVTIEAVPVQSEAIRRGVPCGRPEHDDQRGQPQGFAPTCI